MEAMGRASKQEKIKLAEEWIKELEQEEEEKQLEVDLKKYTLKWKEKLKIILAIISIIIVLGLTGIMIFMERGIMR